MDLWEIKNYKVSCWISIDNINEYRDLVDSIKCNGYNVKSYKNFSIIQGIFKYNLFCNGHINISGIERQEYFKYIHSDINQIFNKTLIKNEDCYIKIDNISATVNASSSCLNLYHLYLKIKDYIANSKLDRHNINIMYEPEVFHAIKISSKYGHGLIFSTGKINYLGIKSVKNLMKFHKFVFCLINELS
jgi:TATA-box binding protein (TBP) (component of TFIID and TFIIIB)